MTFTFPNTNDLVDRRLVSSSARASRWMIRFYSDIKASADTGVTGVSSSTSCRQDPTFTSSALGMADSAELGILLSTLSGLNGNKLLAAKPALIFFGVNAITHAGLTFHDTTTSLIQQNVTNSFVCIAQIAGPK
jgi:hypothetical protein